jgi:hypothetical protein
MLCNDGCSQGFLRLAAAIISPTGKSLASDRRLRSKAILMRPFLKNQIFYFDFVSS